MFVVVCVPVHVDGVVSRGLCLCDGRYGLFLKTLQCCGRG